MPTRHAGCSCGQLTVICEGEPVRVSMCHCLACQQRTGSAFGLQARFAREQVTHIAGSATDYVRVGDGGTRIVFHFCAACGSTVYFELDAMPGFIAVPVGAFADPAFPAPTFSLYEARRHPWLTLPASLTGHMD